MELSLDRPIAGVLVPVFAIRGEGDQGIGDTESLKEFIDWAAEVGFHLVKILPINETGGDHSPYNALSSRALEPTTIRATPEVLPDLKCEELQEALAGIDREVLSGTTVKYDVVKPLKRRLLEAAFTRFRKNHASARKTARGTAFTNFIEAESSWLGKYTLFRVLFEQHEGRLWTEWPEEQQTAEKAEAWVNSLPARKSQAIEKQRQFFAYVQWIAFTQWRAVKAHAAKRGVALMGDIPFGVSFQSADVWAEPRYFRTDWCGGTPPDKIFKHDLFVQKWGQNWGIPLYDWDALRKDNFSWWRERVRGVREFFDLFRIDHVLGFYRIYGFPWRPDRNEFFLHQTHDEARQHTPGHELPHFQPRADDTPEHKEQNRREGEEYLRVILQEAGAGRVIGEDLGEVPDYVRPNLQSLGIAGYKIPQWEKREHHGTLIPGGEYERLSLATYGTHDHDTLRAMWEGLVKASHGHDSGGPKWEMRILAQFAHVDADHPPQSFTRDLHEKLLRALFESNSWIAVVMITDVFGRSERFNLPGVAGDVNWTQRLHAPVSQLSEDGMVPRVKELLKETGRA
jgi:4-alpha-glucanotransferase